MARPIWPTSPSTRTLAAAEANLEAVDAAPTAQHPAECVTDKGYHSRAVLKALDDSPWKTRISEPRQKGFSRWRGDEAAHRAVINNRVRLKSGVAREAFNSPLKKASLTGFHPTAKHNAAKAVSPSCGTMGTGLCARVY